MHTCNQSACPSNIVHIGHGQVQNCIVLQYKCQTTSYNSIIAVVALVLYVLSLYILCFLARSARFLLTSVCDGSVRDKDTGEKFCPNACIKEKIYTLNLVRTISPTHTEVRVFIVFV